MLLVDPVQLVLSPWASAVASAETAVVVPVAVACSAVGVSLEAQASEAVVQVVVQLS